MQIIFNATDDEKDIKSATVKHLIALYEKKDTGLIITALDDWYSTDKKNYDAFAAKYALNDEVQLHGQKLQEMDKWCKEVDISYTHIFY